MDAATLACPTCGAPAAPDAVECNWCKARLATVACPSCYGLTFRGAKHCSHCGAKVGVSAVGDAFLEECGRCAGIWVDAESFRKICERKEERAAFVGAGSPLTAPSRSVTPERVAYIPCPDCGKVMNRINFARHS